MKMTYVVEAKIEVECNSASEAEDLVMGLEIINLEGIPLEEVYIEIGKVTKIDGK